MDNSKTKKYKTQNTKQILQRYLASNAPPKSGQLLTASAQQFGVS